MDRNIKMMSLQLNNQKTTLMILAGISLIGALSLVMVAPALTTPNTTTNKLTETTTTTATTVSKATTVKKAVAKKTPAKKVKRPVYLVSDNINGKTADNNRMKRICQGLKKKGVSCKVSGLGPNTHNTIITNKKTPSNALIVQVYGGKCAGTIWNLGTKWYKKAKGSRKVHLVYLPSRYKINVSWLPRAYDDNFSKISGIARPDLFLKKAGYTWTESASESKIIKDIYAQATR